MGREGATFNLQDVNLSIIVMIELATLRIIVPFLFLNEHESLIATQCIEIGDLNASSSSAIAAP